MRPLRLLVALASLAAVIAAVPAARAEVVPKGSVWSEEYFPSADGTMLHADIFRPAQVARTKKTPVILLISPYLNTGDLVLTGGSGGPGPIVAYRDFLEGARVFQRGYTWIQVSLRGFGASGGCNDFGGPGEQSDVKAAVEWAAKKSSTGEVGLFGISYDGWTQVMALATKPRGLGAAVIMAPVISGYRTLYMNGVHYGQGWNTTMALYQTLDAEPPSPLSGPTQMQAWATSLDPQCLALNTQSGMIADAQHPYWKQRDLIARARGSKVPILWTQGFQDANVKPDQLLPVFSTLRGPHHAWFGQWFHQVPTERDSGKEGFYAEAMRWFDRYVRNLPIKMKDPAVTVQNGDGWWRSESTWPPKDARAFAFPVKAGSYRDAPGNHGAGGRQQLRGIGSWTFTSPFPYAAHIAGVTRVTLNVGSASERPEGANLIALLYDVGGTSATLITRGAFSLKGPGKVSFDLYPQDWPIRRGHRLGLLLAGADESWFNSHPGGGAIVVSSGTFAPAFARVKPRNDLIGAPLHVDDRSVTVISSETQTADTARSGFPPRMR